MFKMIKYIFFLYLLVLYGELPAFEIPAKPDSWIHDETGILSGAEKQDLIRTLGQLQKRSSNQIFVAIFDNIPEDSYLEDFSIKLFDAWKPGLAAEDNGLLMVIFIQGKKIRIETGYGVEDVITDAQSGTVIREYMAPHFQKGDYYGGIKAALDVLIPAMEGKYKIPVKSSGKKSGRNIGGLIFLIIMIILVSKFFRGGSTGYGTRKRGMMGPIIFGSMLGSLGSRGGLGGGSFGGSGGFGGGFGGMSGGGGASGGW